MKHLISTFVFLASLTLLAGCSDDARIADSIGKGCTSDSQCPGELFCSETSPTDVCAATCDSDAECTATYGSGFGCVNGETRCARSCSSDSDCPDSDCVEFTSGDSFCSNSL